MLNWRERRRNNLILHLWKSLSPYRISSLWNRWWCQQASLFSGALRVRTNLEEELRMLHLRLPSSSHRCLPTPSMGSPFGWRTKTIAIHIFGFLLINAAYFLDPMRCHLCHDHNPDIVRVRFWVVRGQWVRVEDNSSLADNNKVSMHQSQFFTCGFASLRGSKFCLTVASNVSNSDLQKKSFSFTAWPVPTSCIFNCSLL